MNAALMIFVRKPEKGMVKTRIAASCGDEAALGIYIKLMQHTHQITHQLPFDKYVFYAGAIEEDDLWSNGYYKLLQADADLGNRMRSAFVQLFNKGYQHICIIGSDCYELTTAIIEQAFELLHHFELVIGPANDGGYYLLAMKNEVKDIFSNIEWSTEKVLQQTLKQIQECNYSYCLLQTLNDMDKISDVPDEWKKELIAHR